MPRLLTGSARAGQVRRALTRSSASSAYAWPRVSLRPTSGARSPRIAAQKSCELLAIVAARVGAMLDAVHEHHTVGVREGVRDVQQPFGPHHVERVRLAVEPTRERRRELSEPERPAKRSSTPPRPSRASPLQASGSRPATRRSAPTQ